MGISKNKIRKNNITKLKRWISNKGMGIMTVWNGQEYIRLIKDSGDYGRYKDKDVVLVYKAFLNEIYRCLLSEADAEKIYFKIYGG